MKICNCLININPIIETPFKNLKKLNLNLKLKIFEKGNITSLFIMKRNIEIFDRKDEYGDDMEEANKDQNNINNETSIGDEKRKKHSTSIGMKKKSDEKLAINQKRLNSYYLNENIFFADNEKKTEELFDYERKINFRSQPRENNNEFSAYYDYNGYPIEPEMFQSANYDIFNDQDPFMYEMIPNNADEGYKNEFKHNEIEFSEKMNVEIPSNIKNTNNRFEAIYPIQNIMGSRNRNDYTQENNDLYDQNLGSREYLDEFQESDLRKNKKNDINNSNINPMLSNSVVYEKLLPTGINNDNLGLVNPDNKIIISPMEVFGKKSNITESKKLKNKKLPIAQRRNSKTSKYINNNVVNHNVMDRVNENITTKNPIIRDNIDPLKNQDAIKNNKNKIDEIGLKICPDTIEDKNRNYNYMKLKSPNEISQGEKKNSEFKTAECEFKKEGLVRKEEQSNEKNERFVIIDPDITYNEFSNNISVPKKRGRPPKSKIKDLPKKRKESSQKNKPHLKKLEKDKKELSRGPNNNILGVITNEKILVPNNKLSYDIMREYQQIVPKEDHGTNFEFHEYQNDNNIINNNEIAKRSSLRRAVSFDQYVLKKDCEKVLNIDKGHTFIKKFYKNKVNVFNDRNMQASSVETKNNDKRNDSAYFMDLPIIQANEYELLRSKDEYLRKKYEGQVLSHKKSKSSGSMNSSNQFFNGSKIEAYDQNNFNMEGDQCFNTSKDNMVLNMNAFFNEKRSNTGSISNIKNQNHEFVLKDKEKYNHNINNMYSSKNNNLYGIKNKTNILGQNYSNENRKRIYNDPSFEFTEVSHYGLNKNHAAEHKNKIQSRILTPFDSNKDLKTEKNSDISQYNNSLDQKNKIKYISGLEPRLISKFSNINDAGVFKSERIPENNGFYNKDSNIVINPKFNRQQQIRTQNFRISDPRDGFSPQNTHQTYLNYNNNLYLNQNPGPKTPLFQNEQFNHEKTFINQRRIDQPDNFTRPRINGNDYIYDQNSDVLNKNSSNIYDNLFPIKKNDFNSVNPLHIQKYDENNRLYPAYQNKNIAPRIPANKDMTGREHPMYHNIPQVSNVCRQGRKNNLIKINNQFRSPDLSNRIETNFRNINTNISNTRTAFNNQKSGLFANEPRITANKNNLDTKHTRERLAIFNDNNLSKKKNIHEFNVSAYLKEKDQYVKKDQNQNSFSHDYLNSPELIQYIKISIFYSEIQFIHRLTRTSPLIEFKNTIKTFNKAIEPFKFDIDQKTNTRYQAKSKSKKRNHENFKDVNTPEPEIHNSNKPDLYEDINILSALKDIFYQSVTNNGFLKEKNLNEMKNFFGNNFSFFKDLYILYVLPFEQFFYKKDTIYLYQKKNQNFSEKVCLKNPRIRQNNIDIKEEKRNTISKKDREVLENDQSFGFENENAHYKLDHNQNNQSIKQDKNNFKKEKSIKSTNKTKNTQKNNKKIKENDLSTYKKRLSEHNEFLNKNIKNNSKSVFDDNDHIEYLLSYGAARYVCWALNKCKYRKNNYNVIEIIANIYFEIIENCKNRIDKDKIKGVNTDVDVFNFMDFDEFRCDNLEQNDKNFLGFTDKNPKENNGENNSESFNVDKCISSKILSKNIDKSNQNEAEIREKIVGIDKENLKEVDIYDSEFENRNKILLNCKEIMSNQYLFNSENSIAENGLNSLSVLEHDENKENESNTKAKTFTEYDLPNKIQTSVKNEKRFENVPYDVLILLKEQCLNIISNYISQFSVTDNKYSNEYIDVISGNIPQKNFTFFKYETFNKIIRSLLKESLDEKNSKIKPLKLNEIESSKYKRGKCIEVNTNILDKNIEEFRIHDNNRDVVDSNNENRLKKRSLGPESTSNVADSPFLFDYQIKDSFDRFLFMTDKLFFILKIDINIIKEICENIKRKNLKLEAMIHVLLKLKLDKNEKELILNSSSESNNDIYFNIDKIDKKLNAEIFYILNLFISTLMDEEHGNISEFIFEAANFIKFVADIETYHPKLKKCLESIVKYIKDKKEKFDYAKNEAGFIRIFEIIVENVEIECDLLYSVIEYKGFGSVVKKTLCIE